MKCYFPLTHSSSCCAVLRTGPQKRSTSAVLAGETSSSNLSNTWETIGWGCSVPSLSTAALKCCSPYLDSPWYCVVHSDRKVAFTCFAYSDHNNTNNFLSSSLQSYGVCVLGLKKLWLLIMVYGFSCSVFSSLSLCLLCVPRWLCLAGGAIVHGVLLVVLMALSIGKNHEGYEAPLLVISVLWGLGTALNKTGVSSEFKPWAGSSL